MAAQESDRADIVALLPIILLAGIVLGLALDLAMPIILLPDWLQSIVGIPIIAASIVGMPFILRCFKRSGTSFDGRKPTDAIIADGFYGYSRNPVYVSSYVLQIGLAIALDSIWLIVTLAPTIAITHYGVVLREAAYLQRKFGDEYRAYMARVRRYL